MCLILMATGILESFPFVMAANRDEFYARPAAPARWWPDHPGLLAGRDLQAGGTWLGVTRDGRVAAVTNVREPAVPAPASARSRGNLVLDALDDHAASGGSGLGLDNVVGTIDRYAGLNLIVGSMFGKLWYCSNRATNQLEPVADGWHGLSNHLLDTPWPKVQRGINLMQAAVGDAGEPLDLSERLLDVLRDRELAADGDLPVTGVGIELERQLGSMFIAMEGYGTRCSTVVLADRTGRVWFTERTFKNAEEAETVRFEFQVETEIGEN